MRAMSLVVARRANRRAPYFLETLKSLTILETGDNEDRKPVVVFFCAGYGSHEERSGRG
jgi:hypothetical protein